MPENNTRRKIEENTNRNQLNLPHPFWKENPNLSFTRTFSMQFVTKMAILAAAAATSVGAVPAPQTINQCDGGGMSISFSSSPRGPLLDWLFDWFQRLKATAWFVSQLTFLFLFHLSSNSLLSGTDSCWSNLLHCSWTSWASGLCSCCRYSNFGGKESLLFSLVVHPSPTADNVSLKAQRLNYKCRWLWRVYSFAYR